MSLVTSVKTVGSNTSPDRHGLASAAGVAPSRRRGNDPAQNLLTLALLEYDRAYIGPVVHWRPQVQFAYLLDECSAKRS